MFLRKKTWITTAHQGRVEGDEFQNTLEAFRTAARKGADMVETDVRTTKDGVFIINHDAQVRGFDESGEAVEYVISETDYADIAKVKLVKNGSEKYRVSTLDEVLRFAHHCGMCMNLDLKEGNLHAEEIAKFVVAHGLRGKTVYGTNGSGAETINRILAIDPEARFIDIKENFTREKLQSVKDYQTKCYIYTGDFRAENIAQIHESGCMLATVTLNENNAAAAYACCPDMMEYSHTSDFSKIEKELMAPDN